MGWQKSLYMNIFNQPIPGKWLLLLFILTNGVYSAMVFITIPEVMAFANDMKLFDMSPMGYDPTYAMELLTQLGTEGRTAYLTRQLPLDMIYPGLFAVTFSLLLAYVLNGLQSLHKPWQWFCWLAVLGGLFDYGENISVMRMLRSYPTVSDSLVHTGSIFTVLKSWTILIYFVVLLLALSIWGYRSMRSKSNST